MTVEEFVSLQVVHTMEELTSACGNRIVIAYGTGKVGAILIPYLLQNTAIQLRGVTNSRITKTDAGTFSDTGLPVRSIEAWRGQLPDAIILVTTSRPELHAEIVERCIKIGFRKEQIFCVRAELEREVLSACVDKMVPPRDQILGRRLFSDFRYWLVDVMCTAQTLQDVHKAAFAEFKGCHKGQSVVLVGGGPSLNGYSQLEGLPHIGVNSVFLKEGLKLDYWFMRDYCGFQGRESEEDNWCDKLKDYDFVKFFGVSEWGIETREGYQPPETIIEENQGRRFFTTYTKELVHCDIEHYPVMGLGSTIFGALHFALYTMPKRILLAGCDCSSAGHFDGTGGTNECWANAITDSWKWVKKFAARFYPGLEIISVNPVGLKGVFRDIYTKDYLDAHPEIDRVQCEVLNPDDYEK